MTTVADIDRQVNADDTVAAHLWPKLGPKVRTAYLHDRDAWIVIRREVDSGKQPSAQTLAAQHKAFAGWARAFRAASNRPKRARPATTAAAVAVALPAAPVLRPESAAMVTKSSLGGAGSAVAGGLVLAGVVALAARRKRA
jgi:hypothetical protein